MNFLKMAMDAPKLTIMPEGEYELRVAKQTDHISKESNKPSLKLQLQFVGQPNAIDMFHYLSIPAADDDEPTQVKKINRMRDFLDAFSVPYNDEGFDPAALVGATGYAKVSVRAGQQGDENQIRSVSVPK